MPSEATQPTATAAAAEDDDEQVVNPVSAKPGRTIEYDKLLLLLHRFMSSSEPTEASAEEDDEQVVSAKPGRTIDYDKLLLLLHRTMSSSEPTEPASDGQVVNPWAVSAKPGEKIDYDKLVEQFGCQRLDSSVVARVERLTARPAHVFLRRGVFFAHRDFNEILDLYERGDKFYLYTGRGPSSESLHLGHLIPFMFTNAFYKNMGRVKKCVTSNQAAKIFGFKGEDNIGKTSFPPVQAVPSFPSSFPHLFSDNNNIRCLIPCAIDQDPYFRMTRDVAPRIGYRKPALIESTFFPSLKGENGKMSASETSTAIYLTDSAKDIKEKVNRYAFSGGQDTIEKHRKLGANLEVDIPVKYLGFFLDDDSRLENIKKEYGSGRMLTGEVKAVLIEVLTEIVERHKAARAAVTDEMVDAFMAVRPLPYMFS